jgi:hypothetical protein
MPPLSLSGRNRSVVHTLLGCVACFAAAAEPARFA